MREENEGNINADVIRDRLADHMRHGRKAAEAAGEERWLAERQAQLGILSRSSVDEIGDIVDEWLAVEMGEEHAALARTAERMYADFLMRHVDLASVSAWPPGAWTPRSSSGGPRRRGGSSDRTAHPCEPGVPRLDDNDHVRVEGWASGILPIGSDHPGRTPPRILPTCRSASRSASERWVRVRTLYYGLYPPEDASCDWSLQEHLQAYLDVVLGRVKEDIECGWTSLPTSGAS
jgi:hypothetical protein